eukprot:CAMPEP_0197933866 /NCGR_PEP_ID=MMETSP1439-20131203/110840_1 /TAXON_ID=66791 /ORGANISM="Gonyaulax spinifera, Strain CCMP409" /LENGTH=203 /DNA_ID=CAMNT_0043556717 /DNA_START=16 /DNA_END=627 /DNA_ORIENTATION=-
MCRTGQSLRSLGQPELEDVSPGPDDDVVLIQAASLGVGVSASAAVRVPRVMPRVERHDAIASKPAAELRHRGNLPGLVGLPGLERHVDLRGGQLLQTLHGRLEEGAQEPLVLHRGVSIAADVREVEYYLRECVAKVWDRVQAGAVYAAPHLHPGRREALHAVSDRRVLRPELTHVVQTRRHYEGGRFQLVDQRAGKAEVALAN